MKPVIGMFSEIDDEGVTKQLPEYTEAILAAGGLPFPIPYIADGVGLEAYLELCDGFLFSGGVDINPERYGEKPSAHCGPVELLRDAQEFAAAELVLKSKKPILAICRGAQLINVALGGSLFQDVPSEAPSEISHRQSDGKYAPSHTVRVLEGTPLRTLVVRERMTANSFHHQAIKRLGRGLSVMATADDGIVEAVYLEGEGYLRAYQWHPERLFKTSEDNLSLFKDFIRAADKAPIEKQNHTTEAK